MQLFQQLKSRPAKPNPVKTMLVMRIADAVCTTAPHTSRQSLCLAHLAPQRPCPTLHASTQLKATRSSATKSKTPLVQWAEPTSLPPAPAKTRNPRSEERRV